MTVKARVARGIALLNQVTPNWRSRIQLGSLSLYSCRECILGQVYGDFLTGLEVLGIDFRVELASEYGFACWDPEGWSALQEAWENALGARRAA